MQINNWKMIPYELYISSHALIVYKKVLYNIYGESGDVDATSSREPCSTIFTFDLINGEENEIELNKAPCERRNHSCTKNGSKFYLFGGDDCGIQVFRNDCYEFDMETQEWKKIKVQNSPIPRRYHSAAIIDDHFYIFGGEDENDFLNDLHELNLKSYEWREIKTEGYKPTPRRYASMVSLDKKLYLFGGRNEEKRMNDMNMFDLKLKKWTELKVTGEIPLPRAAQTMNVFRNSIFIFGGNNGDACNELYEFNTINNHWTKIKTKGNIPRERFWHSSDIDQEEGILYTSGGYNPKDKTLDDCFMIKLPDPISERSIIYSIFNFNFKKYQDIEIKLFQ